LIKAVLFDLGDTLIKVDGTGGTVPHATEMLKRLRTRYKLGVICNATKATGEEVDEILRKAGIRDFFDTVVVSTDVGFAKPQIEIFKIALGHLSAKPSEAVMVGNRLETDIAGANAIGMKNILLQRGQKYRSQSKELGERPNLRVRSLRQVPAAVESLGFDIFYQGAYLMLSFLQNVKSGRIAGDEIERIVENESYQLMMKHHDLTKERMSIVLQSLITRDTPQERVERIVFDSLTREMERLEKIEDFLNNIQKNWTRIAFISTKTALRYLPAETQIESRIHFIFGGHSDGYTVGEENIVFNIAMFLGYLTYLEIVLPHELHHMGLSSVEALKLKPRNPREEKLNLLLGGTKGEGLATYVMSRAMKTRRVDLWSRTYQERMKDINKHFQAIETELLEIGQGKDSSSKEELYDKFFLRMGIAYFVGCRMAETIEKSLGRDLLINCIHKHPAEFFLTYNVAAKMKKEEYIFSEKTIEILCDYSDNRRKCTFEFVA